MTTPQSELRPEGPGAGAIMFQLKHMAVAKILILCGLTALVAGCVETAAQREPEPQMPQRTNMARREGVSPRGASVAIADIQGVSASKSDQLSRIFLQEARARDINLADAKKANYLVRGSLSASQAEAGATFALVWDVYDSQKRRMQRIDDSVFIKGASASLETIDEAVLTAIAAKSADDLAAVLSNMPEAIAAASQPSAKAFVARAPDDGTTSVPGTPPATAAAAPREPAPGVATAR